MTTRDYLNALSLSVQQQQQQQQHPLGPHNWSMASSVHSSNPLVLPGLGSPDEHLLHNPPATVPAVSTSESSLPDNNNGSINHADYTSTDKEEGEVSDAENSQLSTLAANFSAPRPPTGPKNPSLRRAVRRPPPSHSQSGPPPNAPTGPRSPFPRPHSASRSSASQPLTEQPNQLPSRLPDPKSSLPLPEPLPAEQVSTTKPPPSHQREHAMAFIASWHRSGHTFQQLVDEGFDFHILTELYNASGIPVLSLPQPQPSASQQETPPSIVAKPPLPEQPVLDAQRPSEDEEASTNENDAILSNLDTTNIPSDPLHQPSLTPTQADAPDRQNYIARLMAAKSKKPAVDKRSPPATAPQPVIKQQISLPNPPPADKACMALMNLCKTAGFSLPSFEWGDRKGKLFVSRLIIKQLPSHITQWLGSSAATLHEHWPKGNPHFTLPNDSTLVFEHEGLTKQSTKREGARVCHSILTTAIETTGHQKQKQPTNTGPSTQTKETPKSDFTPRQAALPAEVPAEVPPAKSEASNGNSVADEDAVRAAAKRKAQTELLRKKMEALKSVRQKHVPAPTALSDTEPDSLLPTTQDKNLDYDHKEKATLTDTDVHPLPFQNGGVRLPHPSESASHTLGLSDIAPPVASSSTAIPTSIEHANQHLPNTPIAFEFSSSASNRTRKRPVAADFNDDVEPPVMKRPFGQPRGEEDESMIIEASEDEAEPAHKHNSGTPEPDAASDSANPNETSISRKLASSGPLRSVPGGRRLLQLPDRTLTPVSPGPGFDRHQEDILAMKRKIAELEKKRKSKLLSSASATPGSATPNPDASVDHSNPSTGLDDRADEQLNRHAVLSEFIEEQAELEQHAASPSTDAAPSLEVRSTHTSQVNQDWRSQRRVEIQSNLPSLDARSAQDWRELKRLREQMEKLQGEIKKREEDKQRLIEELESLSVHAKGLAHPASEATKDSLASQPFHKEVSEVAEGEISRDPSESIPENAQAPPIQSVASSSASSMSISSVEESSPIADHPILEHTMEDGASQSDSEGHVSSSIANSETVIATSNPSKAATADTTNEDLISPGKQQPEPSKSMSNGMGQSNATTPASGSSAHYADDEPMDSSDDSNKSENVSPDSGKESIQVAGSQPPKLNDSAHFSGDSEDEYEPSDDIMQVDGSGSGHGSNTSHMDQELAEGRSAKIEKSERNDSFSSPPEGQYSGAGSLSMDGSDGMEESEDEYDPVDNFPPNSNEGLREAAKSHDESREKMDDAVHDANAETGYPAAELQNEPNNDMKDPPKIFVEDLPEAERFKPYQSSLHHFRSSRPNPYFSSNARDEPASPSAPYMMDHKLPLCPFELAGGVCNDDKCEYQHLGKLRLAGV